ncbi:MAG: RHS repeat-associated core domain-containing protein [Actinomycetes bacterium]
MKDEYGNAIAGGGQAYGWVGGKNRITNPTTGLIQMGARIYNPTTGQFGSVDPVYGGNPNPYTYPTDPIGGYDPSGKYLAQDGGALTNPACADCYGQGVMRLHVQWDIWPLIGFVSNKNIFQAAGNYALLRIPRGNKNLWNQRFSLAHTITALAAGRGASRALQIYARTGGWEIWVPATVLDYLHSFWLSRQGKHPTSFTIPYGTPPSH